MFIYPITISNSSGRSVKSGTGALLGIVGATTIIGGNSSFDDESTVVPDIGFNFSFYGTAYRSNIYVGSNSYITFGFGSSNYSGLSTTNPGRGILIGAGDRSYQRVYGIPGGDKYTVRFEGANGTSGSAGSPDRLWETTLFSDGVIQIVFGVTGTDGVSCLTKGTGVAGEFVNYTYTANSSVVFVPIANTYTVYNNSYYS